ncbi:MAG: T9SS type A sorting domain-containing protein, partial [Bacteroidales bacterium]|nr:T9SS type A sorting domain-containing protein [Bacteroidales bacterium]
DLPADVQNGINYIDDNTITLVLHDPPAAKDFVFVIGDFNEWTATDEGYMKRTPDGTKWWTTITGLTPGTEYAYQYYIDKELKLADPYCDKILDPWNDRYISETTYPSLKSYPWDQTLGIVSVLETGQTEYVWQVPNFTPVAVNETQSNLVIYEMLIRDFVESRDIKDVQNKLDYLQNLGVNAIELMPFNELEGNDSWGYNPSFYFATDKAYGTEDDYKAFIDECHQRGIAVIMDMVLNHSFGQSPMVQMYFNSETNQTTSENPWYNQIATHPYSPGYDFNHESIYIKDFTKRVLDYWLTEYKIDGFRFDLSKGFTQTNTLGNTWLWGQLDPSRIAIWKRIADSIWSVNPDTYVILEHFAENDEETILANYGMLIWGNENHHYLQGAMGWNSNSDFSWASYQERGWNDPHAIVYMESHDEERMMYKNINWGNASGDYDISDSSLALKRGEIAATFFFTIPGPKMVWQFGELGYDYTINYNGRTGPKPIRWDYYDDYQRKYLHDFYAAVIKLKQEQDVFRTENYTLSLAGPMKRIKLNGNPMSASIIGNFDVIQGSINPAFHHPGKWYEYFTHDSITVIDINEEIMLEPGEYRLYTDIKLAKPDLNTGIFSPTVTSKNISSVYPNPSSDGFNIKFLLKNNADVELVIFNGLGQEIKTLVVGNLPSGEQVIFWDGTDHHGQKAGKGLYFYQLTIDQHQELRKLVVF